MQPYQDETGDKVFECIPLGLLSDLQRRIERVLQSIGHVHTDSYIDHIGLGYTFTKPQMLPVIPSKAVDELKQFQADVNTLLAICREHDPKVMAGIG